MNDLRTAAQQALEALELVTDLTNHDDEIYEAITALKAALAQGQAEPVESDEATRLVDDLCLLRLGWRSDADGDLYRAATDRVIARAVKVRGLRKIEQLEGKA